ncbi:MAG: FCD domain-containing protein, partial [Firmicutes bacterium]|nr:FCD domain-containing protein [Bacillota bacterium]
MAVPFFKVEKQRLYESVVEQLVNYVESGGVMPGGRFPSERELEKQLGVSRGILREAFRVLETRGLIESRPGGGRFLRDVKNPILFKDGITLLALERSVLLDLAESRLALEVNIARLAAERATQEDISRLCDVVDKFFSKNSPIEDKDLDFHLAVARATHNFVLQEMVKLQINLIREHRQQSRLDRKSWEALCLEHRNILKAIADRDPDAAADAMQTHLLRLREAILQAGETERGRESVED